MVPNTGNTSPKVDSSQYPESPHDATVNKDNTNNNNNHETLTDSTPHSDLPEIPEETEPRTLFVGDLSFFCTEQHLHDLFQNYGSIESVQLKGSNDGKPHLSYGFIRFQQHEAATTAIEEMDGQLFLGRTIRVGWASDNPHRKAVDPKKRVPKSNSDATAQVHVSFTVRDSRYPVTEATLRDQFSQYGELLDVTIKKTLFNKHTGTQTGYGFVHYALNQAGISSAFAAVQATNQVAYGSVTYESSFSHSLRDYIASSSNQQPDRVKYSHPPPAASTPSPDLFFHSVPNMQSFPSNIMSYPVSHVPPPPPSIPSPAAASMLSTQYPATAAGPPMGYLPTVMPNPSYYYPSAAPPNLQNIAGPMMTSAQSQSYPHNLMPPQSPMSFPGMATATAYPVPPPTHLYPNQIYFEASPQPSSLPPLHLPPHINTSSPPFPTPRKSSPSTTSSSHSQQNHHQTTPSNYQAQQQPYYPQQQPSPHFQYQQQQSLPPQPSPHHHQQHQHLHVSPTFHSPHYNSYNNHNNNHNNNHHHHSNNNHSNRNNKR